MATRKVTAASKKSKPRSAVKAPARKAASARKAPASAAKTPKKSSAPKATIAGLAVRIDELAARVAELAAHIEQLATLLRPAVGAQAESGREKASPGDRARFEEELVRVARDLDLRGRFGGLVPIPDIRSVFLETGLTREAFDRALLAAEREFVVDLKVANDPSRLARPDLAIDDAARGLLQFVVVR